MGSRHLPPFEGRDFRTSHDPMKGQAPFPESLRVGTGKHRRSPSGDRDRRKVRRTEDGGRRHRGERDRRVDPCPSRHGAYGRRRDRPAEMGRGLDRREDVRVTGDAGHPQPWARDSGSKAASERPPRHARSHGSGKRDKYGRADGFEWQARGGHRGSSERREDLRRTADASHPQHRTRDGERRTASERSPRRARGHVDGRRDKDGRRDDGEMHWRGEHRGRSEHGKGVSTSGRASQLEPRVRDSGIRATSERSPRHARSHADRRRLEDGRRDGGSERHGRSGHGGSASSATQVPGPEKLPSEGRYHDFNPEQGRGSGWWAGGEDREDMLPGFPHFAGLSMLAGTMRGERDTGRKDDPIVLDEDNDDFPPGMASERRLGWHFSNGDGSKKAGTGTGTSTSRRFDGLYLNGDDSVGGSTDLYGIFSRRFFDESPSCEQARRSGSSRQHRKGLSRVIPKISTLEGVDIRRRDGCDVGDVEFIGEVGVSEQVRRRQRFSVVIDLVDA